MDLQELQKNWNELGKADPLWAIMTRPERKDGRWGLEEFFESGRVEVASMLKQAETLGFPARRETALDFGCGVGRLTQALCSWFERCHGVDIAPSMIELARQYDKSGGKCEYWLNPCDDLQIFPDKSFDLVYSNIVLQHMQPRFSVAYIREFVRLLRPGGLVVFQIPERRLQEAQWLAYPAATEPMPDGGFHENFSGLPASLHATAGACLEIPVTVRNLGECAWPCRGNSESKFRVQLGNHWLTAEGAVAVWDDGRQPLPSDLPPQAEVRLVLKVTAPAEPGHYLLELDMVQEAVAWFKTKAATPARIAVAIEPPPDAAEPVQPPPHMEMYGVLRDEVIGILTSAGAHVLRVEPDRYVVPRWTSFRYFATKV